MVVKKLNKMMGCRVTEELDDSIRKRASENGKTVNEVMNESLENDFNNSSKKRLQSQGKIGAIEASEKLIILRSQISKLKSIEEDSFFSGDKEVKLCIKALQGEIEELIGTLQKEKKKELSDPDNLEDWDI